MGAAIPRPDRRLPVVVRRIPPTPARMPAGPTTRSMSSAGQSTPISPWMVSGPISARASSRCRSAAEERSSWQLSSPPQVGLASCTSEGRASRSSSRDSARSSPGSGHRCRGLYVTGPSAVILYFLRHGKAGHGNPSDPDDDARELTDAGAAELGAAAPPVAPPQPAARRRPRLTAAQALQTAELLVDGIGSAHEPIVDDRLRPGADWADMAQALAAPPGRTTRDVRRPRARPVGGSRAAHRRAGGAVAQGRTRLPRVRASRRRARGSSPRGY